MRGVLARHPKRKRIANPINPIRMKTYKFRVYWSQTATVEIQAESKNEAIQKLEEAPLPQQSDYLEDSFDFDLEEEIE